MESARKILEVGPVATPAEIKSAYYKKALALHPDKNPSPDAADRFRELNEAYTRLNEKASLAEMADCPDLFALFREYMPEILRRLLKPVHRIEPNIDDLLTQKIFLYQNKYSVPLWHPTLVFDEFSIKCAPKAEENRWVDDDNNLHVLVRRGVLDVFRAGRVVAELGCGLQLEIPARELTLASPQTHVTPNRGIPAADAEDPFNVSALASVVVHLYLE